MQRQLTRHSPHPQPAHEALPDLHGVALGGTSARPCDAVSRTRSAPTKRWSVDFRRQIDDTPRLVGASPGEAEVIMTDDSQEREAR